MKITPKRFLKTLQTGSCWFAEDIYNEINNIIEQQASRWTNHYFRFDPEDKYWYIYDNECYLFVFDDKIILRSDRDSVTSSGDQITITIKNLKDIKSSYEQFMHMSMEDEE